MISWIVRLLSRLSRKFTRLAIVFYDHWTWLYYRAAVQSFSRARSKIEEDRHLS